MEPNLPRIGPMPLDDACGYGVAFSMLVHSLNPGRHSSEYTQYDTIRKQRSAYSNLYMISVDCCDVLQTVATSTLPKVYLTNCPTNSIWFSRWSSGCEIRMGYIRKQNKAISFLRSFVHSFARSFIQQTVHSFINSFIHSLIQVIHSLIQVVHPV